MERGRDSFISPLGPSARTILCTILRTIECTISCPGWHRGQIISLHRNRTRNRPLNCTALEPLYLLSRLLGLLHGGHLIVLVVNQLLAAADSGGRERRGARVAKLLLQVEIKVENSKYKKNHFSLSHLNFSLDLNGKGDVKVVVGEERRVHELGCCRTVSLLKVQAMLYKVQTLGRPVVANGESLGDVCILLLEKMQAIVKQTEQTEADFSVIYSTCSNVRNVLL
jgi:hypothetical protein